MMEMIDAAEALEAMYKHERDMQTFSESKGYDNIAAQYCEKAEALRAARAVLEGLERRKAKAEDVIGAMGICYALGPLEDCKACPYSRCDGDYVECGGGLLADIKGLLVEAYLQGGDDDEQD